MVNSIEQISVEDLKNELRLDDLKGDPWGTAMNWFFNVAEIIYWERSDLDVPNEWQFSPGVGRGCDPAEDYSAGVLWNVPTETLITFGNLLSRFTRAQEHAGNSY